MNKTFIPAKYVIDVQLNPNNCLNLQCNSLTDVLNALVSRVCSSEIPTLEYKCLPASNTPQQLYQSFIDKLCELESLVNTPDVFSYSPCVSDGWTCGDDPCVDAVKPCNIVPTRDEVIQALLNRTVALGAQLTEACVRINQLEATVVGLEQQISALNECC